MVKIIAHMGSTADSRPATAAWPQHLNRNHDAVTFRNHFKLFTLYLILQLFRTSAFPDGGSLSST